MLRQQSQKIEVIVRKEGGGGEKNNKETDTDKIGGQNGEQSTDTALLSNKTKRFIFVNTTHALAVSKQAFNAQLSYYIGGLGYSNGDEAYQDIVSRRVEVFQDKLNAAQNIAMGMGYGAVGGVPGMILGGALAAVSSQISWIQKYETRKRDYNFKVFKENNAIEYKRARAQINLTTGRLR